MTTTLQTSIYTTIADVPLDQWAELTRDYPHAGVEWCRFAEHILGKGHVFYIIITASDGQAVGGATLSLRHKEQLPLKAGRVRQTMAWYLRHRPLLVCRTAPFTRQAGVFVPPTAHHAAALHAICAAAKTIARQHRASFTLFDYLPPPLFGADWGELLKLENFLSIGTRLSIHWANFDEYLGWLKTFNKGAHEDYRRHTRRAEAQNITIRFHPQQLTADREQALALMHNVEAHYGTDPFPFKEEILANLHHLGEWVWMTAHIDERLVACEVLLIDRANSICTPILYGRDYAVPYIYFYSYYQVLRYVMDNLGLKTFIGESDAYEFKRRLGFELDARNNLVFHGGAAWRHALVRLLMRWM